jgi:nucleoside-diphosphate-sugar epimerase
MTLNAVGCFGYLSKAQIVSALAGDLVIAGRSVETDARLSMQSSVVADLDRRIAQIDTAIDKATEKGRASAAMKLADEQRRTRADLAAQRTYEANVLATLQVEKAAVEGERRKVEADLGSIRHLATLLGANDQDVLRWFILAIALLLDPAAVLLLLAASKR